MTSTVRRRAAAVWARRSRMERVAALRFGSVAERISRAGAPQAIVELARTAASDEVRHAELCAELAASFEPEVARQGLERAAPEPLPEPAPSGLSPREQLLFEVVAMSCLTETLSAALLVEMHARASEDRVRAVVHEVLRDEVQHSRIGWGFLAAERERGRIGFLSDYLPVMLRAAVDDELFRPPPPAISPSAGQLAGLGALERERRLAIFTGAMREVVFPGLAHLGVDPAPGERWVADASPPPA